MELAKHKNHRNTAYLDWLRKQNCIITGKKAQCAHHIRLGTNGGSSLKPSDYFCIPLLNEFHTTGLFAIHNIGEDSFLKQFNIDRDEIFIDFLKQYLVEKFDTYIQLTDRDDKELISYMINLIEEKGPQFDKPIRKKKSKKSITENDFYQKAKEENKLRNNQIRMKLKEEGLFHKKITPESITKSEYYQRAKEFKRERDKEIRAKLKPAQKTNKVSVTESDFYQQAKELKRARDKELRLKIKQETKKKQSFF